MDTQEINLLYPELSDEGKQKALELINKFKETISKEAEKTIMDFYVNVPEFIEVDSWTNYKTSILNGLCGYSNVKNQNGQWNF